MATRYRARLTPSGIVTPRPSPDIRQVAPWETGGPEEEYSPSPSETSDEDDDDVVQDHGGELPRPRNAVRPSSLTGLAPRTPLGDDNWPQQQDPHQTVLNMLDCIPNVRFVSPATYRFSGVTATIIKQRLVVEWTLLHEIPPSHRSELLALFLTGNYLGKEVCGGSINILATGEVVLMHSVHLFHASLTALEETLLFSGRCAHFWRYRINSIVHPSQCPPVDPYSETSRPWRLSTTVGTHDKAAAVVRHLDNTLLTDEFDLIPDDDNNTDDAHWRSDSPEALHLHYNRKSDTFTLDATVFRNLPLGERNADTLERLLQLDLPHTVPGGGVGVHKGAVHLQSIFPLGPIAVDELADHADIFHSLVLRCSKGIQCLAEYEDNY